ncbi:uncharacterized protein V6R79_006643 [Siganus canaliculatus]
MENVSRFFFWILSDGVSVNQTTGSDLFSKNSLQLHGSPKNRSQTDATPHLSKRDKRFPDDAHLAGGLLDLLLDEKTNMNLHKNVLPDSILVAVTLVSFQQMSVIDRQEIMGTKRKEWTRSAVVNEHLRVISLKGQFIKNLILVRLVPDEQR